MADIGRVLPSYCVPDDVVLVRELPTTVHGEATCKRGKASVLTSYPNCLLGPVNEVKGP